MYRARCSVQVFEPIARSLRAMVIGDSHVHDWTVIVFADLEQMRLPQSCSTCNSSFVLFCAQEVMSICGFPWVFVSSGRLHCGHVEPGLPA